MANPIKFTKEELEQLQQIQSNFQQITFAFGQLNVSQIALDERKSILTQSLANTRSQEAELAKSLTEKYGKGTLNIDTGEFTPIEETPENTSEEDSK
jgi:hypothetical protein